MNFNEKDEDLVFWEEDNFFFIDIIRLFSDIRDDIDNFVLFIDDVVFMVMIYDLDKRWYWIDGFLDDFCFYLFFFLFSSDMDSVILKLDNFIYYGNKYINLIDEWNCKNVELSEIYV